MPRPKPDVETVSVLLRLHPDVLAVIDRLRGDASRPSWIMACIGRDLGERSERASEMKAARLQNRIAASPALKAESLRSDGIIPVGSPRSERLTLADVRGPYQPNLKKR